MTRAFVGGGAVAAVLLVAAAGWPQGPPGTTPNLFARVALLEQTVATLQATVDAIQTTETVAFAAKDASNPTPLPASLATLTLPPGDYVIFGKAVVGSDLTQVTQVSCQIRNHGGLGGPGLLDQTDEWLFPNSYFAEPGSVATLLLTGSVSLTASPGGTGFATLSMYCATNVLSESDAFGQFATLTAVRVTTLTQQ